MIGDTNATSMIRHKTKSIQLTRFSQVCKSKKSTIVDFIRIIDPKRIVNADNKIIMPPPLLCDSLAALAAINYSNFLT